MITVLSKLAYLVQLEQVVAVEDCYPHVAYLGLGQDIDHKSHLPGVRKHKERERLGFSVISIVFHQYK